MFMCLRVFRKTGNIINAIRTQTATYKHRQQTIQSTLPNPQDEYHVSINLLLRTHTIYGLSKNQQGRPSVQGRVAFSRFVRAGHVPSPSPLETRWNRGRTSKSKRLDVFSSISDYCRYSSIFWYRDSWKSHDVTTLTAT